MDKDQTQLALRLRRLKLLHFEVVLAVAECGSLTAAADALDRSQPAISQQLAEAEGALGVPLFVRGRQIKPTVYLPTVLRYMRRAVNDSWQLRSELEMLSKGGRSVLRVGAMLVASTGVLPDAIISLHDDGAGVLLEVVEDIASGLWSRFERSELDLIVGRLDERAYADGVRSEALYRDQHCVVVAAGHPLGLSDSLDWNDTKAYPWILPPRNTALRRAIDATFLDQQLSPPQPWIESASPSVNLALLVQANCLNVVSRSAALHYVDLGACSILPVKLKYDIGPIGMVWVKGDTSPALDATLRALRKAAHRRQ